MADEDKKSAGLYRVETVPPPAGESDAYNAPTKVGPMPAATIAAMMKAAEQKVAEVNEKAAEKSSKKPIPREEPANDPPPAEVAAPAIPPPADVPIDVPRLYEEVEDDDKVTLVGSSAQPPPSAPVAPVVVQEIRQPVVAPAPAPAARPALPKKGWAVDALLIVLILLLASAAIYLTQRH